MKYTSIQVIILHLLKTILFFENTFTVFFMNIIVYISTLTMVFLLLAFVTCANLSFTNSIRNLAMHKSLKFFFIFAILSLCGVPPLMGFFAKLFIFIMLFSKASYFLVSMFFIFNMFAMYFYLQNTRYLIFNSNIKVYKSNFGAMQIKNELATFLVITFIFLGLFFFYLDMLVILLNNVFI